MRTEKIDMSLDEIIKTTGKKTGDKKKMPVGKGGARRTSERNRNATRPTGRANNAPNKNSPQKKTFKKLDGAKKTNNRPGLRPRNTIQKKATPQKKVAPAAANKSITQKMAIQRLNKARATLQKAVLAVNQANKSLEKTMPKKKPTPAPRRNSVQSNGRFTDRNRFNSQSDREQNYRKPNRGGGATRGASRGAGRGKGGAARGGRSQADKIQRTPNRGIQKKTHQNANVAIKFRNQGPSGRGKGKASVIRDTLKKEKPATSLDDRFSQLLKSAGRKVSTTRGGRGGGNSRSVSRGAGRGGGGSRGGGSGRGGRGGGSRGRGNRRY